MVKAKSTKPTKSSVLRVRLSDHELTKLTHFAKKRDRTLSQVIREYIRRLPNPNSDQISENDNHSH